MSALWAPSSQVSADPPPSAPAPTKRRLRAVPPLPARMARVPFLSVLIALFGVGMVGLLMVNTTLQNQAFESRALNRQAAQLVYAEAELQSQLNQRRTPEQIATLASALGMRPNPYPAFLVVPSGKVLGEQRRVKGTEMKSLIVKSPAELAAEKAERAAKARAEAAAEAAKKKAAAEAAAKKAAAEAAAKKKAAAEAAAKKKAAAEAAAKKKAQQQNGEDR